MASDKISFEHTKYAGVKRRLGAYFIDTIILSFLVLIIYVLFDKPIDYYFFRKQSIAGLFNTDIIKDMHSKGLMKELVILVHGTLLWFVYGTYLVGKYGATVGHNLMKLRVVREDGSWVGYKLAFLRTLAKSIYEIPFLGFVIYLASFVNILVEETRQAAHDKLVKTVVMKIS